MDWRQKTDDWRRKTDDRRQETDDRRRKTENGVRPPVYKFQRLKVYQLALEYVDMIYTLASQLPSSERFNLKTQFERAATSIVLNIAEGSTGQSNAEQARFLGMATRSYLETIACCDLAERRSYLTYEQLKPLRDLGHRLFIKLQALKRSLKRTQNDHL